MTSAPLKSHLMCSGLPQGSRCRGARVLGASRVGGKVRGRGSMTQLKPGLALQAPPVLQPTSISLFSVLLQHLQLFLHILCSGWNSVCHFLSGGFQPSWPHL